MAHGDSFLYAAYMSSPPAPMATMNTASTSAHRLGEQLASPLFQELDLPPRLGQACQEHGPLGGRERHYFFLPT